jgi:hypothetical protein
MEISMGFIADLLPQTDSLDWFKGAFFEEAPLYLMVKFAFPVSGEDSASNQSIDRELS